MRTHLTGQPGSILALEKDIMCDSKRQDSYYSHLDSCNTRNLSSCQEKRRKASIKSIPDCCENLSVLSEFFSANSSNRRWLLFPHPILMAFRGIACEDNRGKYLQTPLDTFAGARSFVSVASRHHPNGVRDGVCIYKVQG
jgi:hypothetical protein